MEAIADRVAKLTLQNYPDLDVPFHSRWRHFEVDGVCRWKALAARCFDADPMATGRAAFDLVIPSVLLDAGSGGRWRFHDEESGRDFARSDGLALASFNMFAQGAFSSERGDRYRADATALQSFHAAALRHGFQVAKGNPLSGVDGRVTLMRSLGKAIAARPAIFGQSDPRLGRLFDYLVARADEGELPARAVFATILDTFRNIWPVREQVDDISLGDVWRHDGIRRPDATNALMPFHKLSQWLTYSLVEPLTAVGISVSGLDELTGLAEYRNGGLFLDGKVLKLREGVNLALPYEPGEELIVEWRALTLDLLDRLLPMVRERLGLDAAELPLARMLQGGTWSAGRQIAGELRADGSPPIRIASDGTVF